jgi:pyridoxal phosphate enzyme (YggS family)
MKKNPIAKNIAAIKKEIAPAELIAVTKYSGVPEIVLACEAHQYDFGENRVSDLLEKAQDEQLINQKKIRWHFIGHLQTNKVKDLLKCPHLHAIHSIDSLRLLEELLKREDDFKGDELKLFFQVNTSHESEKSGFETSDDLKMAIDLLLSRPNSKFTLSGLMTMGPIRTEDFESGATKSFKDLKGIAQKMESKCNLKLPLKLSMGMSQDYKLAILEGSNYVRIGSAIFKSSL